VELSIRCLLEYITDVLEHMVERPSSALSFALTFLSLATCIPSIFRFAPSLRLASALEKLGAYRLLFCIFFSPPPASSSSTCSLESERAPSLEVAKALLERTAFGEAKELLLG